MSFARTKSISGTKEVKRAMATPRVAAGGGINTATGQQAEQGPLAGNALQEVKAVRDLNQMRLSMMHPKQGLLEYKAYLKGNFNLNVNLPMEDYGFNPSTLATAVANVFGFAPAFDMPRYFMFKG